jgi:putative DNA primase/helicase
MEVGTRMHVPLPARSHKPARARVASPVARRRIERSPDLLQWAGLEAPPPAFDPKKLVEIALGIWRVSIDARHAVLTGRWAASQNQTLPDELGGDVVRFHPSLKLGDDRAPGLIWLLRDIHTDEPCGILRYLLDDSGAVIGRRVLGRSYSTAIKFDAEENVTAGLHIASSVETGIAAINAEFRPVWALLGANALADFPVLGGVEALTIIADDARAVAQVSARCREAGREVICARPP